MTEDAAADAIHERAVPPDQRLEGGLVPVVGEPAEQVGVGQPAASRDGGPAQVTEQVLERSSGHGVLPTGAPTRIESRRPECMRFFFRSGGRTPAGPR